MVEGWEEGGGGIRLKDFEGPLPYRGWIETERSAVCVLFVLFLLYLQSAGYPHIPFTVSLSSSVVYSCLG